MSNLLDAVPFNISLLILSAEDVRGLRPIKVLDIFTSNSKNFHPDGLFSIETFGKVGDERRNRLFGYIDLHLPIIHPVIYKSLVDLKELYGAIIAGTAYAVFNPETKDFDASNVIEGETGFTFFLRHFDELQFEERKSTSREFGIKLMNKYRNRSMISKLIVLPAGLRDFTVLPNGKPEEDEINGLYRKVLSIASVVGNHNGNQSNTEHLDATRYGLQKAVMELYAYIVNLLEGKSKMIQGQWTSRDIFQSTRNVITANVQDIAELGNEHTIGPNHTVAGLFQTLRDIFPIAVNLIREQASHVFSGPNTPARLINAKTLMAETISIDPAHYDEWMTQEGIESTFGRFEIEALRHEEIKVGEHYLGLLYNDGKQVRFVDGIQSLPEGFDKAFVKPVTYAEFYYLAVFERVAKIPALVTRYPVIGFGGIYPSWIYLKTTTKRQSLKVLDEAWEPTGVIANEFPIRGAAFVNSMSPSIVHLQPMGADHDGDTCSFTAPMTDDAIDEIAMVLASKDYYINVAGEAAFSVANDVSNLVFFELTH